MPTAVSLIFPGMCDFTPKGVNSPLALALPYIFGQYQNENLRNFSPAIFFFKLKLLNINLKF